MKPTARLRLIPPRRAAKKGCRETGTLAHHVGNGAGSPRKSPRTSHHVSRAHSQVHTQRDRGRDRKGALLPAFLAASLPTAKRKQPVSIKR